MDKTRRYEVTSIRYAVGTVYRIYDREDHRLLLDHSSTDRDEMVEVAHELNGLLVRDPGAWAKVAAHSRTVAP